MLARYSHITHILTTINIVVILYGTFCASNWSQQQDKAEYLLWLSVSIGLQLRIHTAKQKGSFKPGELLLQYKQCAYKHISWNKQGGLCVWVWVCGCVGVWVGEWVGRRGREMKETEGEVGRGRRTRDSGEEKRTRGMQQCKKATNDILSSRCTPPCTRQSIHKTFKNCTHRKRSPSLALKQSWKNDRNVHQLSVTVDW